MYEIFFQTLKNKVPFNGEEREVGKPVSHTLLTIPTPEDCLPLLYTLVLKTNKNNVSFFNDKAVVAH